MAKCGIIMIRIRTVSASCLVVLTALLAGGRAACYIRLDNDGMRYALVADQILKGRGLRIPITFYPMLLTSSPDSTGTMPVTNNPPLLPIAFAAMGGVRPGCIWTAQVVNVCAHIASSLFSFLITRRMAVVLAGTMAGLLVAVALPLLTLVGQVWSEALFISFFIITIGLLQASRMKGEKGGLLLGSGCTASGAFLTRWIGVTLVPLFVWESLVAFRRGGIKQGGRTAVLTLTLPVVVISSFLTRNYRIMGSTHGLWEKPGPPQSWIGHVLGFGGRLQELLDLTVPGARVTTVFGLLVVPVAILIFSRKWRPEIGRIFASGLDLVLLAAVFYMVGCAHSLATILMYYDPRFSAPLYPLISIAGVTLIASGWDALRDGRFRRCAAVGLAVSLSICVMGEARRSFDNLPRTSPSGDYGTTIGAYTYVTARSGPGSIIVTNTPSMVSFFSGVPTVCLPYRHPWLAWQKIPDDIDRVLPEKMKQIGADYLLLLRVIDGLPREEWIGLENGLPEDVWGKFIADISRGEDVSKELEKVYECPRGVVYKLRD